MSIFQKLGFRLLFIRDLFAFNFHAKALWMQKGVVGRQDDVCVVSVCGREGKCVFVSNSMFKFTTSLMLPSLSLCHSTSYSFYNFVDGKCKPFSICATTTTGCIPANGWVSAWFNLRTRRKLPWMLTPSSPWSYVRMKIILGNMKRSSMTLSEVRSISENFRTNLTGVKIEKAPGNSLSLFICYYIYMKEIFIIILSHNSTYWVQ